METDSDMICVPHDSNTWIWVFAILSIILWIALLVLLPITINSLPEDFFANPIYLEAPNGDAHDFHALFCRIFKNIFGWFLILVVAPVGLSIIAILFGLVLVDIKGKRKAVRWLVKKNCVWHFLCYIRVKGKKPPLLLPADVNRT